MRKIKIKTLLAAVLAGALALTALPALAEGRPVQLKIGARGGYVGTENDSTNGYTATLNTYAVAAPTVRLEFPFSADWSLEAGARYEWYFAELENSTSDSGSDFSAMTLDFGPIWRLGAIKGGELTPFLRAAAVITVPEIDLNAPTKHFKSGLGAEGSFGLAADKWEVRIGYQWMELRPEPNGIEGSMQEILQLPQYFVEANYKFNL